MVLLKSYSTSYYINFTKNVLKYSIEALFVQQRGERVILKQSFSNIVKNTWQLEGEVSNFKTQKQKKLKTKKTWKTS